MPEYVNCITTNANVNLTGVVGHLFGAYDQVDSFAKVMSLSGKSIIKQNHLLN